LLACNNNPSLNYIAILGFVALIFGLKKKMKNQAQMVYNHITKKHHSYTIDY